MAEIRKDWKLTAAEMDILSAEKPFEEKISEIANLTEDELQMVTGGWGGHHHHHHHGYGGYGYGYGCFRWC
jgi:hypothetical protein